MMTIRRPHGSSMLGEVSAIDPHEWVSREGQGVHPADPLPGRNALSIREAAAALGVTEQTVRRAIARGALSARKQGRAYRIRGDDLARYARGRGQPAIEASRARIVALPTVAAVSALPAPASRFVGRDADLAALLDRLADPVVRLVTLTGPGGIGKTRLALAAATVAAALFPDGARFVDLAATTRPEMVVPAIMQAIGLRERAGQDRRGQLGAFLRPKHLLLVLDNFEQIIAAAPEVAHILAQAPGVSVLATSRAPLRIGGEHEVPVPPLSLAGTSATPDELLAADAGRLFVERAQGHDPGFAVNEESAPLVADICARLDGLPLAIELAAAQSKVLPPRQLRDRLERRLPLLTRGGRDAPARLRTMRDAIAWSYQLLTPDEQRIFRRLAVFAGGFTLDAADAVAEGVALDLVASLVDQSLLVRELGPDGEPRFRILETIREFGLEQLEAEEEATVRAAHARYFLQFAQALRPMAKSRSTRAPLDRLAADDANLDAALGWLAEHGPLADLARMVAACYMHWYVVGRLGDAESWLERALADQDQAPAAARAQLLVGRAEFHMVRGEFTRADAALGEGLSLLRTTGDSFDLAMALMTYGALLNFGGKYAEGEVSLGEGLSLAETLADPVLRAAATGRALANLSVSSRGQGDLDLAAERGEEALRRFHDYHLELAETQVLMDLADVAKDQGNHQLAVERYLVCIERTGELGEIRLVAEALEGLASAATAWGQTRAALLLFGAAGAMRERVGIGMMQPLDAAMVERDLVSLRGACGERETTALLAEGGALTLTEAVAIANAVRETGKDPPPAHATTLPALTRREKQVLGLIAEGQTDREIAEGLFLSPRTVNWHVRAVLAKLGAASRRDAVSHARVRGWL